MKKDGIQTRNRKLSTKSKKKRGSVIDFFTSPFDCKPFSYSSMGAAGAGGHHGYGLANGGYYGSQFAAAAGLHQHQQQQQQQQHSVYAAPGTGLNGLHQAVSAAVSSAVSAAPSPPSAHSVPQHHGGHQSQHQQHPPPSTSPLLSAAAAAASSVPSAFGLGPQTVAMS